MSRRTVVISLGVAIALAWPIQQFSLNAVARPKDDRGLINGIASYGNKRPLKGTAVYAAALQRPMSGTLAPRPMKPRTTLLPAPVRRLRNRR